MRLGAVDHSFLWVESARTPMHTASLLTFRLPDDAPPDYLQQLFGYIRRLPIVSAPPFCYRLRHGIGRRPRWQHVDRLDLDYHLRHSALPRPGGERELGVLISRLHSNPLDLSRPPWECHLVEGLDKNRFAVYLKMHRALADGPTVARLLNGLLWSLPEAPQDWERRPLAEPAARRLPEPQPPMQRVRNWWQTTASLVHALARTLRSALGRGEQRFLTPYTAPPSMLNADISAQRRYATQALPLARLQAVAQAAEATVGEVLFCICGAALRRYLIERDALPPRSLLASVPEGLAASTGAGEDRHGRGALIVELGTQIGDHRDRLRTIQQSVRPAREHVQALRPDAVRHYMQILAAPLVLAQRFGLAARIKPYANLAITSTPGLPERRYFRGAELEAVYPASLLFDGQALGITVRRYAGHLDIGIIACRDALPGIQRLSLYLDTAVGDVERAFGIRSA